MPSPFPGMDPYLERSRWFRRLHNDLITLIQEALQPLLPSPYFALMGELIWIEGSKRYVEPDVDVLRLSSARRREDVEGGEEGGVATLVAEAEEEPDTVTVPQSPDGERTEPYLEIYARREGEDRLVSSIEILSLTDGTRRKPRGFSPWSGGFIRKGFSPSILLLAICLRTIGA